MLSQHSLYACWRKHMNMLPTFCKYCKSAQHLYSISLMILRYQSAELEMTVALLVQIDKLVMLIESPIFTCKPASSPEEL